MFPIAWCKVATCTRMCVFIQLQMQLDSVFAEKEYLTGEVGTVSTSSWLWCVRSNDMRHCLVCVFVQGC